MDYMDHINQHCPAAIHESIGTLAAGASGTDEADALNVISSASLTRDCLIGVVGQMSAMIGPRSSGDFKMAFLSTAAFYADLLMLGGDAASAAQIRQSVAAGIDAMIGDIRELRFSGSMLAVLGRYRIDMQDQIAARVNYKEPGHLIPMTDWTFNEYALSMGDPEAQRRLEKIFARADVSTLRSIFSYIRSSLNLRTYYVDRHALRQLVAPYADDPRRVQHVDGPGPALGKYARDLLDLL